MSEDNRAAEKEETGGEGGSRWRELYKTEDYWAIWLGLAIIAVGLLVFLPRWKWSVTASQIISW